MILNPTGMPYGSGLTIEQRIERLEQAQRPTCRVYNDAGLVVTLTTPGTWYAVPMDDELIDAGGRHSTSVNTARILLDKPGVWLVGYTHLWLASAGYTPDGFAYSRILKNGSGPDNYAFDGYRTEAGIGTDQPITSGVDLIVSNGTTDYIESQAMHSSVGTQIIGSGLVTGMWAVWQNPA